MLLSKMSKVDILHSITHSFIPFYSQYLYIQIERRRKKNLAGFSSDKGKKIEQYEVAHIRTGMHQGCNRKAHLRKINATNMLHF